WGFGRAGQDAPPTAAPTAEAIAAAKARTGTDKLEIDVAGATVRKRAQVQVDLSSIAPGLAADRIAAALIELGHPDAMVEVGGEVRTVGVNQAGAPWKIAIERPSAPGEPRRVYTIVALDGGLATSGDYRQFRELDGVRVSHTIDPRTGRPVTHGLTSVTVIAEDAARADALATALMVMGEAEALEFARAHALPVLLLTLAADGTLREQQTEAFAELRTAG
ncbi:MAG: FAD:protein FMN transferase, partial [Myxococcales bacterium]|nr:FAD:protein FMN transferase [Myxococcales bacterium]